MCLNMEKHLKQRPALRLHAFRWCSVWNNFPSAHRNVCSLLIISFPNKQPQPLEEILYHFFSSFSSFFSFEFLYKKYFAIGQKRNWEKKWKVKEGKKIFIILSFISNFLPLKKNPLQVFYAEFLFYLVCIFQFFPI